MASPHLFSPPPFFSPTPFPQMPTPTLPSQSVPSRQKACVIIPADDRAETTIALCLGSIPSRGLSIRVQQDRLIIYQQLRLPSVMIFGQQTRSLSWTQHFCSALSGSLLQMHIWLQASLFTNPAWTSQVSESLESIPPCLQEA